MQSDQTTVTLSRPGSNPHEQIDIVIPATLGSVKLLTQIGQGGMGIVYRGRDQLLNRDVAVKFFTDAIAAPDDPGFTTFQEGARAAATVAHPSITTIYHAGVVQGIPYIIMQLVDGQSAFEIVKRNGPLSRDQALSVLSFIAEAVAELHERNIIHRDIKPSNILVDGTGRALITDFGLSFRRQSSAPGPAMAGTPAYMSPEAFAGEVSPRSDVYALGITAFELLSGKTPFTGTLEDLRKQHNASPLPLTRLEGVAADLIDLLERATHKNPIYRYKSARQFQRALASICDSKIIAHGRLALAQNISRQTGSPQIPVAPPQPSSRSEYFQTIGDLASAKSSDRPASAPISRDSSQEDPPYCLHCGYLRHSATSADVCPECGQADSFATQQQQCAHLARNPFRLLWHFIVGGRPPAGWWATLSNSQVTWFTPLRATLVLVAGALILATIISMLTLGCIEYVSSERDYVDRHDGALKRGRFLIYRRTVLNPVLPRGTKLKFAAERDGIRRIRVMKPTPTQWTVLGGFAAGIVGHWVLLRYGWLVLCRRRGLSRAQKQAAANAAQTYSVLTWAALPYFIIPLVPVVLLGIFFFPQLGYNFFNHIRQFLLPIFLFTILAFQTLSWLRTIGADPQYIFPKPSLARAWLCAILVCELGVLLGLGQIGLMFVGLYLTYPT